uniref:Uncharacterized protein n=1 Tax=Rhynchobrunnera orthospora TaxID=210010 RepID=V5W5Q5_9HELO|nr:hypothetical protein [Rhynchobrunnera orthospora]AHC02404.1 hypothetical protein [Rhynchobrunnera orthospora]
MPSSLYVSKSKVPIKGSAVSYLLLLALVALICDNFTSIELLTTAFSCLAVSLILVMLFIFLLKVLTVSKVSLPSKIWPPAEVKTFIICTLLLLIQTRLTIVTYLLFFTKKYLTITRNNKVLTNLNWFTLSMKYLPLIHICLIVFVLTSITTSSEEIRLPYFFRSIVNGNIFLPTKFKILLGTSIKSELWPRLSILNRLLYSLGASIL